MHRSITRAALAAALCLAAHAAQAVTVSAVSPQGEVAQVRQTTVKCSEPVVPLGDLRLPNPFNVNCEGAAPKGNGRWTDERVWLCDFNEALGPGTRCTLKPRADWKPLTGTWGGGIEFSVSTGVPASAACEIEGIGERVAVRIVSGAARDDFFLAPVRRKCNGRPARRCKAHNASES